MMLVVLDPVVGAEGDCRAASVAPELTFPELYAAAVDAPLAEMFGVAELLVPADVEPN